MSMDWTAGVRATGAVAFSSDGAAEFRAAIQRRLSQRSISANLRHADDQGIAGLAAILAAMEHFDEPNPRFDDWAVIAAPRTPGRNVMQASLAKFANDGAWGVSPQVIPHCSLHSLSGLVSVTFRMTGPNLGVGGTVGRESESFLAAAAFLHEPAVEGVWIVMTGWSYEDNGSANPVCRGVALAVEPADFADNASTLRLSAHRGIARNAFFSLESFARVLALEGPIRSQWSLPTGGSLHWVNHSRVAEGVAA